jgi:cytochrome c oxidase subunit II
MIRRFFVFCILVLSWLTVSVATAGAQLQTTRESQPRSMIVMNPEAPYVQAISPLVWWAIWMSVVVLVGTGGALWYVVHKFRARPTDVGEPPQFHGNNALELILFAVPVAMVAVLTILTANTLNAVNTIPKTGTVKIAAKGWQFWWDFNYTDLGFRNANEMIIPVGQPIEITTESGDVIHSLWLTSLGAKRDAIPGQKGQFTLTAPKPGVYYGQCTELCGASHANMLFRVIAVEPADFETFVSAAKNFKPSEELPAVASSSELDSSTSDSSAQSSSAGREVFAQANTLNGRQLFEANCSACHAVKGSNARGVIGPDLSFLGSRSTIGAGIFKNEPKQLREWIAHSYKLKPGSLMPAYDGGTNPNMKSGGKGASLSQDELEAISKYLEGNKLEGLDLTKYEALLQR